jgi:branched-chain amino acid transport system ATP-binding protein
MSAALECEQLTKYFGGLEVLKNVTFTLRPGERRAIIGPNGAGKTTLFRIISGEIFPNSGSISLFGQDITRMKPHQRAYLGLGRTFQINNLFPTLSVLENLILSQAGLKKLKYSMVKPLSMYKNLYHQARVLLEKMGLENLRDEIVRYLSQGQQRQIEIAMALITNPRLLLLDEPTAAVSPGESKMVEKMISELDRDITILIIEHDMEVAFRVASSITVLNSGEVFIEGNQADILNNKDVQEIYLGTEWKRGGKDVKG